MALCGGVRAAVARFPKLHAAMLMEHNLKGLTARDREIAKRDRRIAKSQRRQR